MNFLHIPNLPESDVALVAMSGTYQTIINAIEVLGIKVIKIRPCQNLSKPVSSHADMLVHHLGGCQVVISKGEEYLKSQLIQNGFDVADSNVCVSNLYPHDVALNAARVGNKLIAKRNVLDQNVLSYCEENRIQIIPVNQGYAKCSTVVIDDQSIITSDPSIAEAAIHADIDVLRIIPGDVELDGYDYGFLGGACGMIGKNLMAFTGNIQTHHDYNKIKTYCSNKNVNILSLTNSSLIDIGGIIPLRIKITSKMESVL
jgi:hypothetical protein